MFFLLLPFFYLSFIAIVYSLSSTSSSSTTSSPSSIKNYGQFVFATCQAGAEKTLKAAILLNHPELRLAFGRPGLVTFKHTDSTSLLSPSFQLNSIFARSFGLSLGPAVDVTEAFNRARVLQELTKSSQLRLHVWGRDEPSPACEHPIAQQEAKATVSRIRDQLLDLGASDNIWAEKAMSSVSTYKHNADGLQYEVNDRFIAGDNDHVFNVIVPTGPYATTDSLFTGYHHHTVQKSLSTGTSKHSVWPGGDPRVILPVDAPSRAYLKIQAAILWSGAPLCPNDVCVEIGSAPGGASLALLRRGLTVVGIDPSPADRQHSDVVANHPNFKHIKDRVAGVKRDQLPAHVDWLVCDANVPPQVLIPTLTVLIKSLEPFLKGVILTMKLWDGDWGSAERVTELLDSVRVMGLQEVRATQLPSNRQEICVYATTTTISSG